MLRIENLSKRKGDRQILHKVKFSMQSGELVSVTGPSGIGKTTLLRCICFLEKPEEGTVTVDDCSVKTPDCTAEEIRKLQLECGMVFQDYRLFKHRNVIQNVSDALIKVKGLEKDAACEIALSNLKKVQMDGYAGFYPHQLSGGQQQRVAIARAVAMSPRLLMLDEPTSALDYTLRGEVGELIRNITRDDMMVLMVSHDLDFAKTVSDRIVDFDDIQTQ